MLFVGQSAYTIKICNRQDLWVAVEPFPMTPHIPDLGAMIYDSLSSTVQPNGYGEYLDWIINRVLPKITKLQAQALESRSDGLSFLKRQPCQNTKTKYNKRKKTRTSECRPCPNIRRNQNDLVCPLTSFPSFNVS
jgi:hypothetical protein